jgi:hypothetical protein
MSMFRRRKHAETPDESADAAVDVEQDATADALPAVPVRPQGPWDVADVPKDGLDRLDLGGLQIPVPPGTEVRVDVNPEGKVVAATLVAGPSAMQLSAFAAPRTAGIWDDVRSEIAAQLQSGGGRAADANGPFGTELHAAVPTEVPGQGRMLAPARFFGVDGPRWFVRALVTGPAAVDGTAAGPLLQALKSVVVVRGSEAMAVRDPLPLRLPKDVTAAATAAAAARAQPAVDGGEPVQAEPVPADVTPVDDDPRDDTPAHDAPAGAQERVRLAPPERGPEIAELR